MEKPQKKLYAKKYLAEFETFIRVLIETTVLSPMEPPYRTREYARSFDRHGLANHMRTHCTHNSPDKLILPTNSIYDTQI